MSPFATSPSRTAFPIARQASASADASRQSGVPSTPGAQDAFAQHFQRRVDQNSAKPAEAKRDAKPADATTPDAKATEPAEPGDAKATGTKAAAHAKAKLKGAKKDDPGEASQVTADDGSAPCAGAPADPASSDAATTADDGDGGEDDVAKESDAGTDDSAAAVAAAGTAASPVDPNAAQLAAQVAAASQQAANPAPTPTASTDLPEATSSSSSLTASSGIPVAVSSGTAKGTASKASAVNTLDTSDGKATAEAVPTDGAAVPAEVAKTKAQRVAPKGQVAEKPHGKTGLEGIAATGAAAPLAGASADAGVAAAEAAPADATEIDEQKSAAVPAATADALDGMADSLARTAELLSPQPATQETQAVAAKAPVQQAPEARFAEANVQNIVSSVRGELLPSGGTMTIRLDPPEIGALQVAVTMKNGLASVAFQTDSAEAAKMMTHTMTSLQQSLEQSGITVDKITVQQTAKSDAGSGGPSDNSRNGSAGGSSRGAEGWTTQQEQARQDQQRRDALERMWRRANGQDVNLVA